MIKFRHPKLRESMVGSWCPSLGVTGPLLLDRSGRGNHGTLTNMDPPTDWVVSAGGNRSGWALNFDGSDDYVQTPQIVWPQNGCTITAWIRPVSHVGVVFSNWNSSSATYCQSFILTDGAWYCRWFQNGTGSHALANWIGKKTPTGTIAFNSWNFVAATWNGSTSASGISLYCVRPGLFSDTSINDVNGSFSGPQTASIVGWIGRQVNTGITNAPFNGQMDSVNIFSTALTPSDIATLARYRGIEHETYRTVTVRGADIGAQTISLGRATETESARSLVVSNPNVLALGRATETESARSVTVSNPNLIALGRAVELETARSVTISNPNLIALGRATESEAARSVTVTNPNVVTLGRATEVESARAVVVSNPNVVTLGRATETESARSVTVVSANTVVLGRATESESAKSVAIVNPNLIALGRATETETTRGVTVQAGNTVQLGRAVESESAKSLSVTNPNLVALGRAVETESARSLSVAIAQAIAIGRATETESARGLTITTGSGSPSPYYYQMMAG